MGEPVDKEILKINLLAIAGSGLLMLLTGLLLYVFRERVSPHLRYFLPIPPLGVAAYVFVFNLFKDYQGNLPPKQWEVMSEVVTSTIISALIVGVFTTCLVVGIEYLKKYF